MTAKHITAALAAGIPLALAVGTTEAKPVGLAIAIDDSGSISSNDFETQRDAYVDVLSSSLIPADGSIAVGVWEFSSDVRQVSPFTQINNQSDKDSLINDVDNMTQTGGLTNLGGAIETGSSALQDFGLDNLSKAVIDVSTDGRDTTGPDPEASAQDAVDDGVDQVNCLGVEDNADCDFIAGDEAFEVTADTFGDVEGALEDKIERETTSVPAPMPLALLGAGLMGLGILRRR